MKEMNVPGNNLVEVFKRVEREKAGLSVKSYTQKKRVIG